MEGRPQRRLGDKVRIHRYENRNSLTPIGLLMEGSGRCFRDLHCSCDFRHRPTFQSVARAIRHRIRAHVANASIFGCVRNLVRHQGGRPQAAQVVQRRRAHRLARCQCRCVLAIRSWLRPLTRSRCASPAIKATGGTHSSARHSFLRFRWSGFVYARFSQNDFRRPQDAACSGSLQLFPYSARLPWKRPSCYISQAPANGSASRFSRSASAFSSPAQSFCICVVVASRPLVPVSPR
jgi:hypothetical protein